MNNFKKGFTLIEVICAVAILGIVMVAFSALLNNALNISNNSNSIDASSAKLHENIEMNSELDSSVEKQVSFNFNGIEVANNSTVKTYSDGGLSYSVISSENSNVNESTNSDSTESGNTESGNTGEEDVKDNPVLSDEEKACIIMNKSSYSTLIKDSGNNYYVGSNNKWYKIIEDKIDSNIHKNKDIGSWEEIECE